MIYGFLLVILVLTSIVLVVAILMQAGKGGGLAANFGGAGSSSDALLGSRQASNILTKTSWWGGGLFLGLAFILSLASGRGAQTGSILDEQFRQGPPASVPQATPGNQANIPIPLTGDTGTTKAGQTTPPTDTGKLTPGGGN